MLRRQHIARNILTVLLFVLAVFLSGTASAAIEADKSSAVVFVYQHVGEDMAEGNISLEQFKAHIQEIKTGGYNVIPLPELIDTIKAGKPLPRKTLAITFDGAWVSNYNNAFPLLKEAELPFTVFFATDMAEDGAAAGHMTWSEIKKLARDPKVSLGIMTANYSHMAGVTSEETAAQVNKSVARFREKIDSEPLFFAYPFGEYSLAVKKQIATYHFKAAFGQQSGVVYAQSDFMSLPRFTMTDSFGDLDRFRLTANALPLPVTDVVPEDVLMTTNPPMIGFTVTPDIKDLSKLSCFISDIGRVELTRLTGNRIEIRPSQPFADRTSRINCTIPEPLITPGEPQNWRWFGLQFTDPDFGDDASEPSEDASDQ